MVPTVFLPCILIRYNPSQPVGAALLIAYYHHSSCIDGSYSQKQSESPPSGLLLGSLHNLCLSEPLDTPAISPNSAVIPLLSMLVTP